MFEHMKNYKTLLGRVASWMAPGGRLFVHIFVHRAGLPYHYEASAVCVPPFVPTFVCYFR